MARYHYMSLNVRENERVRVSDRISEYGNVSLNVSDELHLFGAVLVEGGGTPEGSHGHPWSVVR